MERREFAGTLVGIGVGLAGAGLGGAPSPAGVLPLRPLGRTGAAVTLLGLGGHHVGLSGSEAEARRLVDAALGAGIRFFDTAGSYQDGRAESWLGAALDGVRRSVFLASKTVADDRRTAAAAERQLERSLARLRTDYLDLWQLHGVRTPADVDRAFAPDGAMTYLREARRRGLVRFIGVTGHATPAAHLRALEHWDRGLVFDAMQLPLNPVDFHEPSFQRQVLPGLIARGIGVIAIKALADGALVRDGLCEVEECLRYVWSLPVSVAVVGMERPELVYRNAAIARRHAPLAADGMERLRARAARRAGLALEWYKSPASLPTG